MMLRFLQKLLNRSSEPADLTPDSYTTPLNLNRIKVSRAFRSSRPRPEKLIKKTSAFLSGYDIDPIVLDENSWLLDGYCTYLIYKALGVKHVNCTIRKSTDSAFLDID